MRYTEEQEKIINTLEGNIKILACAGSGKTEVVSKRVANILKNSKNNGVISENIVCFTFTEKAADELRARILEHIEETCPDISIGDLFVGTVHSYCFKLLKEFEPKYRNYRILNETLRIALLSNPDNFHRVGLDICPFFKSKYLTVDRFCESVDVFREELIDFETVNKFAKSKNEELFQFMYERYIDMLNHMKLIDFSGILFECFRILQDNKILKNVKDKYRYLICDEYQDINTIQEEIIKKIWGDSGNICVIGDDDQSIYHWRGTKAKYIIEFEERYPNVQVFPLSENFRTSERIFSIDDKVVKNNIRRVQNKMMISKKLNEKDNILIDTFSDEKDEAEFIIQTIKRFRGKEIVLPNNKIKKFDYGDFAILYRSVKNSGKTLIKKFEENDIHFCVRGGVSDLFSSNEIDFIAKCFAFISDLSYLGSYTNLDDVSKILESITDGKIKPKIFEKELTELKGNINKLKILNLQRLFQNILQIVGVKSGIYSDSSIKLFGRFSELISDFEDINYPMRVEDLKFFMGFIEGYAKNEYTSDFENEIRAENVVTISTIHQSKGLQFNFVFVPAVNEGIFPIGNRLTKLMLPKESYPSKEYTGDIEDERRLFYVAITRAINYLSVSNRKERNGKQIQSSVFFKEFIDSNKKTPVKNLISKKSGEAAEEKENKLILSPSAINRYLTCPFWYKLNYVFGFNPGVDPAIGFGNQIHFLIHFLLKESKNKPPTKEYIEDIVNRYFFLRFAFGNVLKNMKDKAKELVTNYVKSFPSDFINYQFSEKEFYIMLKNLDYKGVVDLILSPTKNTVSIIDFKTGKDWFEDYETQLKSYVIGVTRSYKYDIESASVHMLSNNERRNVSIVSNEIKNTEILMQQVAKKINKNDFPYTDEEEICKKCDFKMICPHPEGEV